MVGLNGLGIAKAFKLNIPNSFYPTTSIFMIMLSIASIDCWIDQLKSEIATTKTNLWCSMNKLKTKMNRFSHLYWLAFKFYLMAFSEQNQFEWGPLTNILQLNTIKDQNLAEGGTKLWLFCLISRLWKKAYLVPLLNCEKIFMLSCR